MNSPANRPPRKGYGAYSVENNAVMYTTKDDQKVVTTGLAWVDEAVFDPQTGHLSYLVSVVPVIGEPTKIRIVAKDMGSSARMQEMIGNARIWIISEADRSSTTILQPAEY